MSNVISLPASPEGIESGDDPGGFVVAALDRARAWLQQASTTDLPAVIEAKARAEAIRCYLAQKELGVDAQLAAAEIVRRAERRIGELVREGQANGVIRRRGDGGGNPRYGDPHRRQKRISPASYFPSAQAAHESYTITDGVSAEEFEDALGRARTEGNLTRANVVRKVRELKARRDPDPAPPERPEATPERIRALAAEGRTSVQIASALGIGADRVRRIANEAGVTLQADEAIGRVRRLDSNRIVRETVDALEGLASVVDLVEHDALDAGAVDAWAASLRRSLRALHRFTKELSS